jgi:hypothetical protein
LSKIDLGNESAIDSAISQYNPMQKLKVLATNIKNYLLPTPEYCADIQITEWIENNDPTLPLDLSGFGLTQLPKIPLNCQSLDCSSNKLKVIDQTLYCRALDCGNNQLVTLPELPNCLDLYCSNNQLTALPELSKCKYLICGDNKLTALPELPNCMNLACHDNDKLTVLPVLPVCTSLNFCGTNISNLPDIPKGIYFYCDYRYLCISKKEAKKFGFVPTLNYHKYARIIQRNYKKYLRKKYGGLIHEYLLRDPSKIVSQYIC